MSNGGLHREPDSGLYALVGPRVLAGEGDLYVLCSGDQGALSVVDAQVVRSLASCGVFRALPEHAASIAGTMAAPATTVAVLRGLEDLRRRGHFHDEEGYLSRLRGTGSEVALTPGAIYIRTCRQPEHLRRLLGEIHGNQESSGIARTCVVVDDSADDEGVAKNRATIDEARQSGLDAEHLTPKDFACALATAAAALGIEREAAFDLLLPGQRGGEGTYGAALNRVLLWSAGERVLLLDDDSGLNPLGLADGGDSQPILSAKPWDLRYLHADTGRPPFLAEAGIDPLTEHEALLGHAAGADFAARPRAMDGAFLRGLDSLSVVKLAAGGRIRLSSSGVLGDSGSPSSLFFFLAPLDAVGDVLSTRESYDRILKSHHVWRGHRAANISPVCALTLTTLAGMDNRELLPPVMPRGRGEDDFFAAAVEFVYPDTFVAELPWALEHAMERRRGYGRGSFESPNAPHDVSILTAFIRNGAEQYRGSGAEFRTAALSTLIRGLAEMKTAELEREWVGCAATARISFLAALRNSLQNHRNSPAWIRADIQRLIELNADIGAKSLRRVAPDVVRRMLDEYGRGLALWPALWRYFREHKHDLRREAISSRSGNR